MKFQFVAASAALFVASAAALPTPQTGNHGLLPDVDEWDDAADAEVIVERSRVISSAAANYNFTQDFSFSLDHLFAEIESIPDEVLEQGDEAVHKWLVDHGEREGDAKLKRDVDGEEDDVIEDDVVEDDAGEGNEPAVDVEEVSEDAVESEDDGTVVQRRENDEEDVEETVDEEDAESVGEGNEPAEDIEEVSEDAVESEDDATLVQRSEDEEDTESVGEGNAPAEDIEEVSEDAVLSDDASLVERSEDEEDTESDVGEGNAPAEDIEEASEDAAELEDASLVERSEEVVEEEAGEDAEDEFEELVSILERGEIEQRASIWKVTKCVAAIVQLLATTAVPAAKLLRIKKYIEALGGAKQAVQLLLGATTRAEKLKAGGEVLVNLSAELLGISTVKTHCF